MPQNTFINTMLFSAAVLFSSFSSAASDDALSVDRVVPADLALAFPNDTNQQPDLSDFTVQHFVLMSNDAGERWAVVTMANMAQGNRSLSDKHLMAILANGQRISPQPFTQMFRGGETLSLTLYFGDSKFPLLSVYARTKP